MNAVSLVYSQLRGAIIWGLSCMFLLLMACNSTRGQVIELTVVDFGDMQATRDRVDSEDPQTLEMYSKLMREADDALTSGPFSVMHKTGIPPSGDKHDYMSMAPYFYSDNKKYAQKAQALMQTWFIDSTTRMNQHLDFGQGIPGVIDGRPFGVIEFGGLKNVITTLELLKLGGDLDTTIEVGVKEWLRAYSQWLQTSELGTMEGTRTNIHGTTYDVQLCSILLYLGEKEQVRNRLETITKRRIAQQIEPDGSQPRELERTKAFTYSTMNLSAFTKLAWYGKRLGVDLWNYKTEDGRGLKKGYEFLIPYLTTNKKWEYQQIKQKTTYRDRFAQLLLNAGHEFDAPSYVKIGEDFMQSQRNEASKTVH